MKPTALCVAIAAASMLPMAAAAETPDYFVEWVKPSAALYVDTGVKGNTGVKAELKATHVASGTYPVLLGSWNGDNKRFNLVMSHDEKARWEYGNNMQDFGNFTWYGGDFTVQVECTAAGAMSSTWTNNKGETITRELNATEQYGILNDSNLNLYLFGSNLQGTPLQQHLGRLYYCRLWTDYEGTGTWTPARNLRPCVKDGVAGLYDSVNDEILYPGTGTLLAGPVAYDTIATWNGGAAPTAVDLATASNWTCTDANGTAVASIVPDKATLVAFPGGVGSVTLPAGYVHTWGAVKVEGPVAHPVTMYGTCAAVRSNMVFLQNQYTLLGEGDVGDLNKIGGAQSAANYYRLQMRHDGWFYVNAAQAGTWTMNQDVDDYFGFYIDGKQVLFNHTWDPGVNNVTCNVTEGWHRFTTIVADTGGGWGVEYKFGNDYVPFTITVNGSTYILSDNTTFPKGSGTSTLVLSADANWSALGKLVLQGGVTIDLNGHSLVVDDVVADDYLGTSIKNSAAKKSVLYFLGEPIDSRAYTDGIIKDIDVKIVLAKDGDQVATWTGAVSGDPTNAGNWEDLAGEPVVPTASYTVKVSGNNVNLQAPAGTDVACKAFEIGNCTFTADCDWRGLSHTPLLVGAANLNGHVLSLNHLVANSGAAFSGGEGSTVEFTPTSEGTTYAKFGESAFIDNIANLTASGDIKFLLSKDDAGGTLTATELDLGKMHYAEFVQTSGAVDLGNVWCVIGGKDSAAGHGVYRMTGGTLTAAKDFTVGSRAVGEFIQTGGEVTLNNWLNIGRNGGTGTYSISRGALINTFNNPVYLGAEGGTGTINVSGDASVNIYQLSLGGFNDSGNKGYVNVSENGSFVTRGWGTLGQRKNGYGEINQTGGKIEIGAEFTVGEVGTGIYNMEAGEFVSKGNLYIGRSAATAKGTFTQNGGSLTAHDVRTGVVGGSTGLYTLNRGTADTVGGWARFGQDGIGSAVQNGGTFNANDRFYVGETASAVGSYTINGGILNVKNVFVIGGNSSGSAGGVGEFVQNGGTVNANPTIFLGGNNNASGTATYVLNDGTLNAPSIKRQMTGAATVILNGGTIKPTTDGNLIEGINNLVFGNCATIDTVGCSVAFVDNTVTAVSASSTIVKAGEGTLTVEELPQVDKVKVEKGTLAISADSSAYTPAKLEHRWSFSDSLVDSVTGDTGAVKIGDVTFATSGDSQVARLAGGAKDTSYIDLGPNKIVSNNATLEFWVRNRTCKVWTKMFNLGDNTGNVLGFTFNRDNDGGVSGTDVAPGGGMYTGTGTLAADTPYYMAFTFAANDDGSTTVSGYCFDLNTKKMMGSFTQTLANWKLLEKVTQTHFWLGHSFWNDFDAYADYDEVRVWSSAISENAVKCHAVAGPDVVFEGGVVDVASGATLDLGGKTLVRPILTGNGTIANGTMTVSDKILVNVGDCITASGTVNFSADKLEIADPDNLKKSFTFLKPDVGASLTVAGKPEGANLPKGWIVTVLDDGTCKVTRGGMTLFVR